MDAVSATLRHWAATPLVWGLSDCSAAVLAYVRMVRGSSTPWPIRIRTERGAAIAIARAGGLDRLAGPHLEAEGCTRIEASAPQRGDVGVIDVPGAGAVTALHTGTRWAVRGDRHVTLLPLSGFAVLAMWRP